MNESKNIPAEFHASPPDSYSLDFDWGELRSSFASFQGGTDTTDAFKKLPGASCPCPHWGYLIKGKFRVIYADRVETITAGQIYYMAPGHNVIIDEDVQEVVFSPIGEWQKLMEAFQAAG